MKILHFADLHIGIENYGRVNPETGLNRRLEDFLNSLDIIVDTAISQAVDLVLFAGDAFQVNDPTPTHQKVFAERIFKLSEAKIPTFLLIGNHDQSNKHGEAHALDIYATLNIPHVYVSSKPQIIDIDTASGPIQIATLPHIPKSGLMATDFGKGTFENVDQTLMEKTEMILQWLADSLDPETPSVLAAHVGVEQAKIGSEHNMSIGYGFMVPLHALARPEFNYVALGHIHKHQILCEDPPVVYPGSVDRVDFGEEKEDKGFMLFTIEDNKVAQKEFVSLNGRPFLTIDVNLCEKENPLDYLLNKIKEHEVENKIIRLIYTIESHRVDEMEPKPIREVLDSAFFYSIRPNFADDKSRARVPELNESIVVQPMEALEHYLKMRDDLEDIHEDLLKKANEIFEMVNS